MSDKPELTPELTLTPTLDTAAAAAASTQGRRVPLPEALSSRVPAVGAVSTR